MLSVVMSKCRPRLKNLLVNVQYFDEKICKNGHGNYLFQKVDMVVVVGRASKGFKQLFQKEYLHVIMSSTRTAWLIMMWAHSQDHSGVDNTHLTSMQVAWVVFEVKAEELFDTLY